MAYASKIFEIRCCFTNRLYWLLSVTVLTTSWLYMRISIPSQSELNSPDYKEILTSIILKKLLGSIFSKLLPQTVPKLPFIIIMMAYQLTFTSNIFPYLISRLSCFLLLLSKQSIENWFLRNYYVEYSYFWYLLINLILLSFYRWLKFLGLFFRFFF